MKPLLPFLMSMKEILDYTVPVLLILILFFLLFIAFKLFQLLNNYKLESALLNELIELRKELKDARGEIKKLHYDNFRRHEHLRVLLTGETPVINIDELDNTL